MKKLLVFILLSAILSACSTLDVYEKTFFFPQHEWKSKDSCAFSFTIEDTASLYNIYVVIRHEDAYHYNNIWLLLTTQAPGEAIRSQQVDVTLGDNKKGWLGSGMDDVFDHRARITHSPVKLKKGEYTFILKQNMREEPLQFILNTGIRVEKVRP